MSFANTPVDSLLQAAGRKCSGQECENAISLLEEAVRIQPGNPALYYQIGFCYSGGCRQHRLVHPALAENCLRHALAQTGTGAAPLLRANILDTLGNLRGSEVAEIAALEEAIACHREAAELYRRSGRLDDWAREEFNQANVWCDLPEDWFPAKWSEAITHYEGALRVRTRESDPRRYAATLMNLGTALRQLRSGNRAANIMRAVRCYRGTLRVYSVEAYPDQFAEACNNLANACLSYPSREEVSRTRHAVSALRFLERALQVWTPPTHAYHYALAQYNRGCAYLQLTASPEGLQNALACLTDAYDVALSCRHYEIARLAKAQVKRIAIRTAPASSRPEQTSQGGEHVIAGEQSPEDSLSS